jgi:hypothetical protein
MSTPIDVVEETESEIPEGLVARLEAAQRRYSEVVVAASDGDPAAAAEARALELQIDGLLHEVKRESLAAQMRQRQELAAREQAMRDQQARDRETYRGMLAKRDEAFALTRNRLAAFVASVTALLEVEASTRNAAAKAGEGFRSEIQTLSNLVATVGREVGLADPPIGWVPAAERNRLRERFGDLLSPDASAEPPEGARIGLSSPESHPASSPRCGICAHPQRGEIEAALADGTSYREVEATFGVSRSALTRHKQHDHAVAAPATS